MTKVIGNSNTQVEEAGFEHQSRRRA